MAVPATLGVGLCVAAVTVPDELEQCMPSISAALMCDYIEIWAVFAYTAFTYSKRAIATADMPVSMPQP